MFFEKRKAKGLEHLHGIIHAISNRKIINFKYQKFWETEKSKKVISPYALKEFKNRWYVLGTEFNHNNSDFKIKSYGLDRISDLEISSTKFIKQKINIEEIYKNSFGIFNTEDSEPQEIILSFDREQANYIKALKLHDSQEIISDDLSQTTFKVYLVPTYDFQREILSYGNRVKIISPESLKSIIKKEVKSMLENLD